MVVMVELEVAEEADILVVGEALVVMVLPVVAVVAIMRPVDTADIKRIVLQHG